MKKAILRNAILVLFITACGCTKDNGTQEDVLPPITQTGANTFGFMSMTEWSLHLLTPTLGALELIVGLLRGFSVQGYYIDTEHYSNGIEVTRYTNIKNAKRAFIYLYKLSTIGVGKYVLNDYSVREGYKKPYNNYMWIYAKSPSTGELNMYYSYENSGEIIITRESENGVSGTFSGKLKSADGNEMVEVTEGRFDIDYNTYQ